MESADVDNWRAVDACVRPVRWSDILGSPDSASYLSDVGREVSRRIADDLTSFFGETWLPSVMGGRGRPHRVPHVFRTAPWLALSAERAVDSYLSTVSLWASVAVNRTTRQIQKVRNDVRANLTEQRFLHTTTMLRLGAIARSVDMNIAFEPTPGDLAITVPGSADPVTIEVVVMGTPLAVDTFERQTDALFAHVESLSRRDDVHFDGQLPDADTDVDGWRLRTSAAAAQAARLGISIAVETDGRIVHAIPGGTVEGAQLEGPPLVADAGTRIQRKVRAKATQVAAAPCAWLWIENHGAVDMLNSFNQMAADQRAAALRDLTEPALNEFSHMRGLTFSTPGRPSASPGQRGVTAGSATLREIDMWPGRTRTSISVSAGPSGAADALQRLLLAEESWLDWAVLQTAGVRVGDLIA